MTLKEINIKPFYNSLEAASSAINNSMYAKLHALRMEKQNDEELFDYYGEVIWTKGEDVYFGVKMTLVDQNTAKNYQMKLSDIPKSPTDIPNVYKTYKVVFFK